MTISAIYFEWRTILLAKNCSTICLQKAPFHFCLMYSQYVYVRSRLVAVMNRQRRTTFFLLKRQKSVLLDRQPLHVPFYLKVPLYLQIVKNLLRTDCKCHGVSGSCAMKTCWKSLPPFRAIGDVLMKKYNRARYVQPINDKNGLSLIIRK